MERLVQRVCGPQNSPLSPGGGPLPMTRHSGQAPITFRHDALIHATEGNETHSVFRVTLGKRSDL